MILTVLCIRLLVQFISICKLGDFVLLSFHDVENYAALFVFFKSSSVCGVHSAFNVNNKIA